MIVQHVSLHSRSNWNLAVMVFEERGKPEKSSRSKENQTLPTHVRPAGGIDVRNIETYLIK